MIEASSTINTKAPKHIKDERKLKPCCVCPETKKVSLKKLCLKFYHL